MKNRTIVLRKEDLDHMPKSTHEFKVIKHRLKKGQHFKVDEGVINNINFVLDEDGYIKPNS